MGLHLSGSSLTDVNSAVNAAVPPEVTAQLAADSTVKTAAASAVASELTNQGVLFASNAPALDTTRVPDPQAKTSGGVATTAAYSLSRITTGLPTGFSYGIETARINTVGSTIGQAFVGAGASGQADPLRIPVTVGEAISTALQVWTDQASARARLDLVFYKSDGTTLSTTTGTYSNVAQNTWERRYNANVTVPATAAYVVLQTAVSTQDGSNTTLGAKTRMTGGVLVTGNVAQPAYYDGTSVGWAWSGAAHGSTAKKVLLGPGEFETPAGSQAKVDAHAAASDPHPQYVKSSVIPAIQTNRVPDPQAKTSGGANATLFTLGRITTNLPTGFAFGLETTRTGTLSSIIGQPYVGSTTSTDPLRIPVTATETVTASAMLWTDQSGAKARLDMQFFTAAGAFISQLNGTYTAIAQSAWEQRSSTFIVPATAGYATLLSVVVTVSGSNTVTGAKARMTGGMMLSGTVPTPPYGDGTTEGWLWSGAAHASTSQQSFFGSSEALTIKGLPNRMAAVESSNAPPITGTKTGSTITLSTVFDATKTLMRSMNLTGSNNGAFSFSTVTLDGATIHAPTDDITPIRTQLGTIGGNHGYACVAKFTNPDAKTTADLGSVWHDTAGREYVLLALDATGNLVIGGDYTSPSGVVNSVVVNPLTDLTHVSGATHTGTIDHTTRTLGGAGDLFPSTARITTTVWADGKQIVTDGVFAAREFMVRESYAILDYAAIYDTAKAHVGTTYTAFSSTIAACVRVSNTYRWNANGRCRVTTSLTELKPTTLGQCGAVQSSIMSLSGATVTRYLPGVGTVAGFDWTAGVSMAAYATDVVVASTDVVTTGRPPAVSLDVLDNGAPLAGFALGYLPYGARGDETSTNANRLTHASTKLWDLRSTQKNYPTFTTAEAAGWGHVAVEAFRAYLAPAQVAAVVASKGDAASAWEVVNAAADLA